MDEEGRGQTESADGDWEQILKLYEDGTLKFLIGSLELNYGLEEPYLDTVEEAVTLYITAQ